MYILDCIQSQHKRISALIPLFVFPLPLLPVLAYIFSNYIKTFASLFYSWIERERESLYESFLF